MSTTVFVSILRRSAMALVPLALGLGVAMFYVDRHFQDTLIRDAQSRFAASLGEARAKIEGRVRESLVLTRGMEAQWAVFGSLPTHDFRALAAEMQDGRPEIRNIGKSEDLIVTDVFPLKGNEAVLGLNYRSRPEQLRTLELAIRERRLVLTGPINLVQGGIGLVLRAPVFLNKRSDDPRLLGVISLVVDLTALLNAAVRDVQDLHVAVRQLSVDGAGGAVIYGEPAVFTESQRPVLLPILLPEGRLEMAAIPHRGWGQLISSSLIRLRLLETLTFFGLLVAAWAALGRRYWQDAMAERDRSLSELIANTFSSGAFSGQSFAAQVSDLVLFCHEVVKHSPVAVLAYASDGHCVVANQAAAQMVGGDVASMIRQNFRTIQSWQASGMLQIAEQVLADGVGQGGDYHLTTTFGRDLWATCMFTRLQVGGQPHLLLMMADITERKQSELDLKLYANLFHSTMEGIVITDTNGVILSVNSAFTDITGFAADDAIGRTPSILKSDHHDPSFYRQMWLLLQQNGRWSGEVWNRRKSGEVYLETQTITRILDSDGQTYRYVGIFNDITELRQKDQRIMHLAFHDALTGLPNRLLIQDRLEHALTLAMREHRSVAVMFIDLDRFKLVNDTLGHDMGDNLLQEVARRLRGTVRATDTVGRLGGDEFIVLLELSQTAATTETVAEKILEVLSHPIDLNGTRVTVTPSIGISVYPQDGAEPAVLMKNADTAMYEAKEAGRNTFRYFDSSMNHRAVLRLELDSALRSALENREFRLFYQVKMDLEHDRAESVEALIRWQRPGHGFIPPNDFIPLLEENGLIVPLGYWIIDEACRQVAAWRQQGLGDIKVAVNISARQLAAPGLVDSVRKALATHYVPASLLELELTETAVMSDVKSSSAVMCQLKDLGVTLAVDDFGTGYSSLSYLRRLPIDTLKIDRSFINELESSREDAEIIRTIISMGKTLNLSLVAEGVETEGQVDFLRDCSCGMVQGYYFSRPLDPDSFSEWVKNRE